MKMARILIVLVFYVGVVANAQAVTPTDRHLNDSLSTTTTKLKQLYLLSTSSSDGASDTYKQQFFDAFPGTFKQLDELYGDHLDAYNKPAPLNGQAEQHIIGLFNKLDDINDTLYYRKIISIAVNGRWDGDAINFFQHGLREKVLNNPMLVVTILKDMSNQQVQSFWFFYFDGPNPEKQLDEPLKKIKSIDDKVYNLMTKAHNDVLIQDKK